MGDALHERRPQPASDLGRAAALLRPIRAGQAGGHRSAASRCV